MKLSEAIRRGSKIARRRASGLLFDEESKPLAACVLGAAILGVDPNHQISNDSNTAANDFTFLRKKFPDLSTRIKVPERYRINFELEESSLEHIALVLNDDVGLPRNKIADWLERRGY